MPDPNILFQTTPTPTLQGGFQNALLNASAFNDFQTQPLRNRLLDTQVTGAEAALDQNNRQNRRAGVLAGLQALAQYPTPEARRAAAPAIDQFVRQNYGVSLFDENGPDDADFSDTSLQGMIQGLQGKQTRRIQSSEILPDGTTVQVFSDGITRVTDPQGNPLQGQDRADAIQKAVEFGAQSQRLRSEGRRTGTLEADIELGGKAAGTKKAGEQAIKKSEEAFDQLSKVKANIANIDETIRLVDEGAGTGPIQSKFPSIRKSSIALDNMQARLGLDVIGNTTFGALSENELKFALSAALPTNLDGPELKQWLIDKREAQQKLANYLEEAAIFLGEPGNTVGDWMEIQREKRQTTETSQTFKSSSGIEFTVE